MNRIRAFFTLRFALLILIFGFVFVGLPKSAAAQSDITDDETVDVTDDFCDPDEGDDCEVESVASILDSSNQTDIDTYAATFITPDLLDYGYEAYVEGYLYQDSTLIADGDAYDDGGGTAELDGATTINLADGPYAYEMDADSYLYDGEEYYGILSTEADATLGAPVVTSVSPAYVFVGTSGSLTIHGQALVNPFGGGTTSVSAVPATTGATGLTISGDSFSDTQGTATYQATLTASAGPWDIGLSTEFGGTIYATTTKGLFTVGDPTPSITSISPSTWTAGTTVTVTITGSGFGSNPGLTVGGAGITSSITSHSDTGGAGGAKIIASVTIGLCTPAETASIIVTSTGYNGTGFAPAYSGQSSSGSSTATVAAITAPAPTISFGGKNVTGTTSTVVIGQQITLTGTVPSPQSSCLATESWSVPTGTAVGGATAATASGFKLTKLPGNTTASYGPFYWVYAVSSNMTFGYKLTNGLSSTNATTTFTVKGLSSGKMATANYGKLNDNTLTVCNTTTKETVLAYGNISGTTCAVAGTPGELFTASGTQPGTGKFTFVQLINSDTSTFTSTSGTVTCTHNAGVDMSYPYAAQINTTQSDDAPYVVLPTSPYNKITRAFSASMYLLWTSSTASAIPVPIGAITWQFSGATTLTNSKWGTVTGSGTANAFVAAIGTQSNDGFPSWAGPSDQTCN
jgi:hypothetical protein